MRSGRAHLHSIVDGHWTDILQLSYPVTQCCYHVIGWHVYARCLYMHCQPHQVCILRSSYLQRVFMNLYFSVEDRDKLISTVSTIDSQDTVIASRGTV